jgi:hypothetical protein
MAAFSAATSNYQSVTIAGSGIAANATNLNNFYANGIYSDHLMSNHAAGATVYAGAAAAGLGSNTALATGFGWTVSFTP